MILGTLSYETRGHLDASYLALKNVTSKIQKLFPQESEDFPRICKRRIIILDKLPH